MKRKNLKNKIPYSALATMPLFSLPIILSLSAGSRYIDEPRYVKDLETRRSYTNKLNFETTFSANGLDRLFNGTTKIIETEGYTFFTNLFYPQDSWFNTAATKIRTRNSRAFPRITYNNGISGQNSIIKIANDTYSGTQIWKSENHRGTASYLNPEPYEVWKYNTNLDRIKEQAWFGADKNLYKGIYDAGREAGSRQALVDNGDFAKHSFNNLNLDISTESKLNNWINSMNISIENGNSSDFADQFRNSYFYNSKSLLDDNSSIRNALKEAIKRKYNEIKRSIASNFRITKFEVKNLEFKINFKFAEEGITGGALNFHYRLNNKIEKFKIAVNIDFAYETKNDSETITKQNLYNHLNNSKRLFLSSDFLENGVFEIPTDTGFERGLNTEKIAVDDTSNWEYAINKLNGYNFQSDSNFSSQLKMETYQDGEKLRFFIRYHNPFNNRTEHFLISENISVKYNPTDKFRNKDISSRLKITPGKYLDLTNPYSLELVDDKPVLIQESNKPVSRTYGGKWLYNAPAKLQFTTTIREDEVLFVNNQKVDVLDRNFQFNLADLRLEKTENNGQETSGTNEYEISVVKYNKTNANEENREEVSRYTIFIIIQSANNIVNGKWFAWDPENNPKQKELIEEFLVDKDNNFILDKNGNKINNPKFDPLIDKKTGTKKQIVWVEFKNSDLKLPNNTRFIQDPLNERNELLDNNEDITWGFIAEASVVGKGINLVLDDINNSNVAKRFLINKNNNEIIELINDELVQPTVNTGNDITLTSQENNYFSSSGIWLFTSRTEKGIDAYKMFLIGENSPKDLFTNTFPNESITPFWSSIKGKHLYSYLNQVLNIDNSQIFKLSYEEILNYWKLYINEAYVGKINNETISIKIKPVVNIQKILETTRKIEKEDFVLNEEIINSFLADFENKDKVRTEIEILENSLTFKFEINESTTGNNIYTIDPDSIIVNVIWKSQHEEDELNKNKIDIVPEINIEIIKEGAKNTEKNYFDLDSKIEQYSVFENKDKVNFSYSLSEDNWLRIEWEVKPEFRDTHYIKVLNRIKNYKLVFASPFSREKYQDIFKNFNLKEINLKGLSGLENLELAKKIVTDLVINNMNSKFVYGVDYTISNLDTVLRELLIEGASTFDNPLYKKRKLELDSSVATPDKYYLGYKLIDIFNLVNNTYIPPEKNIINYNINDIELENISNFKDLRKEIIKRIDNDLREIGINFEDYLIFENEVKLLELLKINTFNQVEINLIPKNFLLSGSKTINISNDLRSEEEKSKEKENSLRENDSIDSINKDENKENKSFFSKKENLYWFIPLVIVFPTILLGLLGVWLYYRFGKGAKLK